MAKEYKSFEEAMLRLEEIVNNLDKGEEKLENLVSSYEEGMKLCRYCEDKLKAARLRIEKVAITDGDED